MGYFKNSFEKLASTTDTVNTKLESLPTMPSLLQAAGQPTIALNGPIPSILVVHFTS